MAKLNRKRYCECGCGMAVKPGKRFIHGHNKSTLGTAKPKSPAQKCECGCGKMTNEGRRFVNHHNPSNKEGLITGRGWNTGKTGVYSAETLKKMSDAKKGKPSPRKKMKPPSTICQCGCEQYARPGNRFILGHNQQKHPKKISQSCKCGCGETTKPGNRYIDHHSPNKNRCVSQETRQKQSMAKKGKPSNRKGIPCTEEQKKILSKVNTGKKLSQQTKDKIGQANIGKILSQETRNKISISIAQTWKDPEIVAKKQVSLNLHPNKPESTILNLLNQLYPDQWKFTGDFSFMINGKNPDFAHHQQGKLIELFGNYWHEGDDPQERIDIFKPYGYDTLVIWERELKNISRVKFRIHKFMAR